MGSVKRADQLRPNQRILTPDKRLLEACEDLRRTVEHPNERSDIIMQQGLYKQLDPEAIMTVKVDGVEVGYKVKKSNALEMSPYFDRYVYMKVPGHRLKDLTKPELKAVMTALLDTFFEPQQGQILQEIIAQDAMLIRQRFMVCFPVERNLNIVSLVGGFQA